MRGGPLISILDDAWAGMATWAPETMLVSVKEFPEDKARRECHTDPKDNEERPLTLIILSSRAQARKRMDHALEDHRLDRVGVCRYRPLGGAAQKSTVVYCRTELRHRARTTGDNTGRYSSIRRSQCDIGRVIGRIASFCNNHLINHPNFNLMHLGEQNHLALGHNCEASKSFSKAGSLRTILFVGMSS